MYGALISRRSSRCLVLSGRSCVVRVSSLARYKFKPRIRRDCFFVAHTGLAGVFTRQSCCNRGRNVCVQKSNRMVGSP